MPTYTSGKGTLVSINDVRSEECPVSVTDGWIFELLMDFSESGRFEHSSPYGSNLSEWPADVFDAFAIFHYEENRIESSKMDADKNMMSLR